MYVRITLAGAALASLTAVSVLAHSGATGIVKERMDGMSAMAKVVKSLSSMMRAEVPFDAEKVRQGAGIIEAHSGDNMLRLFPEGSGGGMSVAKPEIWEDWKKFEGYANDLGLLARGLAAAADNGLAMGGGASDTSTMMGTSSGSMMGTSTSSMMGTTTAIVPSPDMLALMPTDGVFNMVAQACAACHTQYRLEKN